MNIEQHVSKLVAKVKYPVIFKRMDKTGLAGKWLPMNGTNKYSSIEISNSLSKHEKLATLLHEIGHSKCSEKGCSCIMVVGEEGERHAYMYTLQWLLEHKCKKTLKIEMRYMVSLVRRPDHYGKAVRHIMATVLWEDCKHYTMRLLWLRRLFRRKNEKTNP